MNDEAKNGNGRLSSIATLRSRARQHIENGAVTETYAADRATVLRLLNEALATELVCTLRYRRHYFMANGVQAEAVKEEFRTHAAEELEHADRIAARIVQLDGEPNFDPRGLAERRPRRIRCRSISERHDPRGPGGRTGGYLLYKEMVDYVGAQDPTTRRLLEEILAKEEEHAEDLSSMLNAVAPTGHVARPAREK